ncbi:MAG: RDD family protein [Nitrospiraceae bacterium]
MQGDGVLQDERARSRLLTEIYPKAHVVNRGLARSADLLIAAAIDQAVPSVGFLVGLAYLLAADGMSGGRSLGKRLMGLQTWSPRRREAVSFGESIVRNLPVALAFLLYQVPYVGWVLLLVVLSFEGLLVLGNDRGLRFGDILAQTQVVDADQLDMPDSR